MSAPRKLPNLERGQEMLVAGEWYPIIGCSLLVGKDGTSGSVFTLKPRGNYEPWLGYRIDYSEIEEVRQP